MPQAFESDEEWLVQLPATLSACAERWHLVIGERLEGGLVGQVFACATQSGEPAVLKLNPPSAAEYVGNSEQQAAALRAWSGRGAIELLEAALDLDAFLTRRAVPGTPLEEGNEDEAIRKVAAVLDELYGTPVPAVDFDPLVRATDEYLSEKLRIRSDSEVPASLVEEARSSARKLALSSTRQVLLHGDLMDKNLLMDQGRLVAIDPMPCVGDPHSDLGFWAATRAPVPGIERRAIALAGLLRLDPERASRWAAVYAVGEACESWRQDVMDLRDWAGSSRARHLLAA